ncbi:MAG TPA: aconitate hydratase AcnA [Pirellulaceae bacterium]|jgi:aconitate hydratase|nr:aconitate hydratase AcnA [Pirellulaceae bacterium]
MNSNPFDARGTFDVGGRKVGIYRLSSLEKAGVAKIDSLPYSIRVLLESALRNVDGFIVSEDDVRRIASWNPTALPEQEIPFLPARVVLQDFTGVPAVVDLAAMREAMSRLGGDPKKINPLIPVDLVIDHSVQVDRFGTPESLEQNVAIEFERNLERYEFLRWGQKAFANFRVVPPNTGIVHQVNLEYLAKCVFSGKDSQGDVAYPDSLVGTDSHTTMINGLGVVGWGVGGIEAEGVMLGQPIYMLLPEVIGFRLSGALRPGATATDLVLTVTQILRKEGVVNKFVEFFGPGVSNMSLADRATIGNMAPEYGATIGFFPVDAETLRYMQNTGRTKDEVALVEAYCKEQGLFRTDDAPEPKFSKVLLLDLADVEPSLAGPKRPQDRVPLAKMKSAFQRSLQAPIAERGFALDPASLARTATVQMNERGSEIGHGAVVIAAITSCTNTSNPSVMMAAGILAKKAVEKGLSVKPYVKTSLAPGSRVVTEYYRKAGVMDALDQLGFNVVGYGCTTCIGNSGPLPEEVGAAVKEGDLVAAAVLSGNRNFEGRVNPLTRANYLASPPLVVAYALAGTVDVDFDTEPVGYDGKGKPVFLKEIWPTHEEVQTLVRDSVLAEMFLQEYGQVFDGNPMWNAIKISGGELYDWQSESTYIQNPPFLADLTVEIQPVPPIEGARVLLALGDSVTTDHISPAGAISKDSPAGRFLQENGVAPADFNSYGSRRGNDRVMVRGTFANIRIRNALGQGKEGGWTTHFPDGELLSVYDAAMKYQQENVPLVILAGAEYGTGSSRDWAAKGTFQLGVRAVIAASYERIHRSNLVMMGVLPLQFASGETWESLGLTGTEVFDIPVADDLKPGAKVSVTATNDQGAAKTFDAIARIDTLVELDYYRNGGILQTVLRKLLKS